MIMAVARASVAMILQKSNQGEDFYRNIHGQKFNFRIFGGNEAEPHEFPFLVRMNKKVGGGLSVCGASILSNRWIITGKFSSLDLVTVGWDFHLV